MKPIEFLGDSLDRLREFPDAARQDAGYQLGRVQEGLEPQNWKPMTRIGKGVREIRIREAGGAFRIVYMADIGDRVHVLHAFRKKSQKTARKDLDLAKQRFADLRRT